MKLISIFPLIAAVALAGPFSAQGKDKHDKHDHGDKHHDNGKHHDSHDRGHGHSFSYHSYPSYRYGGYGYGNSPYYYSRPSVGISFYSRPSYSTYRGRQVYSSYSDSLAVDVQRELRRRGYYRGPIDGDIGPGSRSAIRAYQYDRGLSATGRIDSSLLRSLGIG